MATWYATAKTKPCNFGRSEKRTHFKEREKEKIVECKRKV